MCRTQQNYQAHSPCVPPKWTKTDVRALCGHIDAFMLFDRPLSDYRRDHEAHRLRVAAFLAEPRNRTEVVLSGIRSARARAAERYRDYCTTVGNQLVRFTEYGQPDELVERFTKLAREEDRAEKKLEALLHRILDEGLPPEVLAHDPFLRKT